MALAFISSIGLSQTYQYGWNYYQDEGNPNGINTESDAPGQNAWIDIFTGGTSTNVWSDNVAIPFTLEYYGSVVTDLKASTNGIVTFDTASTLLPNTTSLLPSAFDIGADEFNPAAIDLDLLAILSPVGIVCEDNQQTVEVIIRNNSTDTLFTIPYQLAFTGTPADYSMVDTIPETIAPFETDTVLLNPFSTLTMDSGELSITLQAANDAYAENNVLSERLVVSHLQPTQPQFSGDTLCAPDSMAIWTASALNGTALWYTDAQSDSVIHVGSPLQANIQATTTRLVSFANRPSFT